MQALRAPLSAQAAGRPAPGASGRGLQAPRQAGVRFQQQQVAPAAPSQALEAELEAPPAVGRRAALAAGCAALALALQPRPAAAEAADVLPATIRPELAPDWSTFDAADTELREAAALLQRALDAPDVAAEEALWSEIISRYGGKQANWVPDLVGRAYGNRGNSRSRQGKLAAALADYNAAAALCPWSVDPILNRGVVLEALGRFPEAVADYRAVLAVAPDDPAAWNNLGNATAGLGDYKSAAEYYGKAAQLAPQFSFAQANRAAALYQAGQDNAAIKQMRALLRRYPDFPDPRAALAAALWEAGLQAEAEQEWGRVSDPRYRDRAWLRDERRWPPRLVAGLEALLDIRGVPGS